MVFTERMMDALAITLGVDPLDMRKRNFYGQAGGTTPYGLAVDDNIIHELVAELETTSDYRARRAAMTAYNASSRILKKGLALTPIKFGISFTLPHLNQAGALVHVYSDGSIHGEPWRYRDGVRASTLKVAQVVAEEFGVDLDRIKITATTTAKVPNTSPTAASAGSDLKWHGGEECGRQNPGPYGGDRRAIARRRACRGALPRRPRLGRQSIDRLQRTGEKVLSRPRAFVRYRLLRNTGHYLGPG